MRDRVGLLVEGRREQLERILGRQLGVGPGGGVRDPEDPEGRYLFEEATDLYWNDLNWEHLTDEEQLEGGPLTEMVFPGFLAFVRGLLLEEANPDSLAPASPRPDVVHALLCFLAERVVALKDELAEGEVDEPDHARTALGLTNRLIDLVLFYYHGLDEDEVTRVERAVGTGRAAGSARARGE